jgi:hypothetical protein
VTGVGFDGSMSFFEQLVKRTNWLARSNGHVF